MLTRGTYILTGKLDGDFVEITTGRKKTLDKFKWLLDDYSIEYNNNGDHMEVESGN